jgi:septum formation protein
VIVKNGEVSIPFVLASASPRRTMLLEMIGLRHTVTFPSFEEASVDCDVPPVRVLRLAREKAYDVKNGVKGGVVLGADTLVVQGGRILEKPSSREDALGMLSRLSNNWHEVYTGLHLIDVDSGRDISGYEMTRVRFRDICDSEIDVYMKTGEPMDKAGSYGIQGFGAVFIDRIEGCYFNVVGLPLTRLMTLLNELGFFYDFKNLRRK